jgi:hypothetical protein
MYHRLYIFLPSAGTAPESERFLGRFTPPKKLFNTQSVTAICAYNRFALSCLASAQTDALLAHKYDSYSREYAPYTRVYEPQTRVYAPQTRVYEPQTRVYEPQTRVYESQTRVYESQTRVYAPQTRVYEPSFRKYIENTVSNYLS